MYLIGYGCRLKKIIVEEEMRNGAERERRRRN